MKKIISIILVLFIVSCGAKKSKSSKKLEESKTEFLGIVRNSGNSDKFLKTSSNLNSFSVTVIDDQNQKITKTNTYKSINPDAPASYIDGDGKMHELNNAEVTEKTIIEKNNRKSENSENSQKSDNSDLLKKENYNTDQEIKINAETKKIDQADKSNRDQWQLPFWIWLILAIIVFLIMRYLNNRFHVTTFVAGLFQFRKK
jgi:lipopolysaccharide export LptBFGC system permease protein LptF